MVAGLMVKGMVLLSVISSYYVLGTLSKHFVHVDRLYQLRKMRQPYLHLRQKKKSHRSPSFLSGKTHIIS